MKAFVAAALLLASALPLAAQAQFRLFGQVGKPVFGDLSYENLQHSFENQDPEIAGLGWELIIKNIGISGEAGLGTSGALDTPEALWRFQATGAVNYHLFGAGSFIDPFVFAGLGSAGQVTMNPERQLAMNTHPVLGFGGNLDFRGFFLGSKVRWTPQIWDVPNSRVLPYAQNPLQLNIYAGFSFGPRRPRTPRAAEPRAARIREAEVPPARAPKRERVTERTVEREVERTVETVTEEPAAPVAPAPRNRRDRERARELIQGED